MAPTAREHDSSIEKSQDPYLVRWLNFDGYKTRFLTAGNGEPLILLHGGGAGSSATANFRPNVPVFAKKYSVYAPEYLGFGLSDKPAEEHCYDLSYRARQVVAFMDSLCMESAYFVGNSYGGMICYYMAVMHPNRMRKMVVQGGPLGAKRKDTPGSKVINTYTPTFEMQKAMCENLFYNKEFVTDDLVNERLKMTQMPGAIEALKKQWAGSRLTVTDRLGEIHVPTLIIHGRHDSTVPIEDSIEAAKAIPGAQLRIFENAGHSCHIEEAEAFNKAVLDFFA
jgi:2-hydroxymuconate-semialdehyde hydrolase